MLEHGKHGPQLDSFCSLTSSAGQLRGSCHPWPSAPCHKPCPIQARHYLRETPIPLRIATLGLQVTIPALQAADSERR